MPKLGRKRAPNAIKILRGDRKSRLNKDEPVFDPDEIPAPPETLNEYGRAKWVEIYAEVKGKGVLSRIDRGLVELACQSWTRFCEARINVNKNGYEHEVMGKVIRSPSAIQEKESAIEYRKSMAELGLTPASRSVLKGKDPDDGKDAELLAALMGGAPPRREKLKKSEVNI